jgi:hypothetical protein
MKVHAASQAMKIEAERHALCSATDGDRAAISAIEGMS